MYSTCIGQLTLDCAKLTVFGKETSGAAFKYVPESAELGTRVRLQFKTCIGVVAYTRTVCLKLALDPIQLSRTFDGLSQFAARATGFGKREA